VKHKKEVLYKNKRLPCDKIEKDEEEVKEKRKSKKKSPIYIRKKISSSIAYKIKRAGLHGDIKHCKYINIREMVYNIEEQFDDNMNWKNYGIYWDIDHIVPQCLFDFTDSEQVKMCWSRENVRPLVREENARKSNEVDIQLIKEYGLFHILEVVR